MTGYRSGKTNQHGWITRSEITSLMRPQAMENCTDAELMHCPRRTFLSAALVAPVLSASFPLESQTAGLSQMLFALSPADSAKSVRVVSPDGHLEFQLLNDQAALQCRITFKKTPVVETLRMGMKVDQGDVD